MSKKKTLYVPLNRVEGDLEVRVEVEDNVVVNAWSSGLMYRGFERIMIGRGAMDGLVITPRVCGICSTCHLTAAARALDVIAGVEVPPDAHRVRNLALMTEHIQSDMRHSFLMYAVDFVNPHYQGNPLFEEAVRRYEPFKGETVLQVLRETKKILGIVAIFGGQWPHSSYMVPGGITSVPSSSDLFQCRLLLLQYKKWYENRIIGCSIDRWLQIRSMADLDAWLEEDERHMNSDMGFFIRFARSIGLEDVGGGHGNFISYPTLAMPEDTRLTCPADSECLFPGGLASGVEIQEFDQKLVEEYVSHSWFEDYEGGLHPSEGITEPYASGREGMKYSWAKAPRYDGLPAETGPLAEMIMLKEGLFTDYIGRRGPNAFIRQLARLVRPAVLIPAMEAWLSEITPEGTFYKSPGLIEDGEGYGLVNATRGALGHWVKISNGMIERYQIITPTAWNASPRDSNEVLGPLEQALIGTSIEDTSNPVELGHVVRSFDCCLVCTVHTVQNTNRDRVYKTTVKV